MCCAYRAHFATENSWGRPATNWGYRFSVVAGSSSSSLFLDLTLNVASDHLHLLLQPANLR